MSDFASDDSAEKQPSPESDRPVVTKPAGSAWLDGLMKTAAKAANNLSETAQFIAANPDQAANQLKQEANRIIDDPTWNHAEETIKAQANFAAKLFQEKVMPQLTEVAQQVAEDPKVKQAGESLKNHANQALQSLEETLKSQKTAGTGAPTEENPEENA